MDAAQALADLTEISSQIRGAVIVERDGKVVASTYADDAQGERVARAALELLQAAEATRGDSSGGVAQLQAEAREGSVFLVRDGERMIVAVTGANATTGLVFYDLKTCLRLAGEDAGEKRKPKARTRAKKDGGSAEGEEKRAAPKRRSTARKKEADA